MRDWIKKNASLLTALSLTAAFLVAMFFLFSSDNYFLVLLPLAGLVLTLFLLKLETGLMVIALLTPFAVDFALVPGMELSMPVEPMMILFSAIFLFRVLVDRNYDLRILRHPVSVALLALLVWMFVTSCTSQLPEVSFKYLAARLWFVLPFYFAAVQIFRDRRRVWQFFWCYAAALVVVILISTVD